MSTYHEPSLLLGDGDMTPNKTDKSLISGALEFMSSSLFVNNVNSLKFPQLSACVFDQRVNI